MSMHTIVRWAAVLSFGAAGCALQASAASPAADSDGGKAAPVDDGSFTFALENDAFTGSDNNYTNGLGFTWVSPELKTYGEDSFVKKWGKFWSFLPFVGDDGYDTYAAWSIAQEMNTPDDIDDPNPPKDDQPYAGILYVDSLLYARKDTWTHIWELKLGVVGPWSQAEGVQKDFHKMIGSNEPQGWDTQLPGEPVINVGYTIAHLAAAGHAGNSAAEWRIVPIGTAAVGNYFTGAGVGVYGEFGWNLVKALGGASLRSGLNAASSVGVGPVDGWSVSFFGGLGGYGVAHYMPLDGTVFHDSRSVDSEPFIGTGSIGFSVRHRTFAVSFAQAFFTDTFDTERQRMEFGTVSISWGF